MFAKLMSFFMSIIMFLLPWANYPKLEAKKDTWKTEYTNVFVHGLGGWGEYDIYYNAFPYWGVMGGDLIKYLNARGFDCVAASVDPAGSAWDRACELYAQITGTRVDYGKAHSERCNHSRYGKNYKYMPLVDKFDSENKINLLGHSFGGATVLQFLDLLADGSEEEKAVTPADELSGLFTGGKADYVHSVTALSAPMNGTTATEAKKFIDADPDATPAERAVVALIGNLAYGTKDKRIHEDTAGYDMELDRAMELLDTIETQPNVYYYSIPCCATETVDGVTTPKGDIIEDIYEAASGRMVKITGYTDKGYYYDESWQPNDGLVNTKSARAPFNAPQKDFDENNVEIGVWNVLPTLEGDHMALMGDFVHPRNIRQIYVDLLNTINAQ